MLLNPEATFDCLLIAHRLQRGDEAVSVPEVHLFSYLACVLWLYQRNGAADWGYQFVGTELGSPFSLEIDAALRELSERGYFIRVGDKLQISEPATTALDELRSLAINDEREDCLEAACSCTSAFSPGMVGSALAQEPDLRRARAVPATRALLEDTAQAQLYEQFTVLREALRRESADLRVPAVVWLTALYRLGNQSIG